MTVCLLRVPKIPFKAPAGLLRSWQSVFALLLLSKIWMCATVRPPQQQKLTLYTILLK